MKPMHKCNWEWYPLNYDVSRGEYASFNYVVGEYSLLRVVLIECQLTWILLILTFILKKIGDPFYTTRKYIPQQNSTSSAFRKELSILKFFQLFIINWNLNQLLCNVIDPIPAEAKMSVGFIKYPGTQQPISCFHSHVSLIHETNL